MTIDPFIKSSFNGLLKLQEVKQCSGFIIVPADARAAIPISERQAGFNHCKARPAVLRGE